MHLSLEVLLTVGADEEVSLTETERIRLLADYIQETELIIYLLFSTVIILFIFILFYFISVSTYHRCFEITECKLYMRVDDTKITSGIIQCLWHEEYRIQNQYTFATRFHVIHKYSLNIRKETCFFVLYDLIIRIVKNHGRSGKLWTIKRILSTYNVCDLPSSGIFHGSEIYSFNLLQNVHVRISFYRNRKPFCVNP
jgi:hypothetical protein